jgi:5-hydroxyisourate hydrolase-like protein (transthyretin family)
VGKYRLRFASGDFGRGHGKHLVTLTFYVKISFLWTPIFVAFLQLPRQK